MDWHEACDHIAHKFRKTKHKINDYLATHGTVLSDEVGYLLVTAMATAGEAQHEITSPKVPRSANKAANTLNENPHEAKQTLLETLHGQIST